MRAGLIGEEIRDSLAIMDGHLDIIHPAGQEVEFVMLQHYRERIRGLVGETELDERRIAQEAAIAADRSCIAENSAVGSPTANV
jgi:uncharacterized protein YicC (UPF0701 family)